MKKKLSVMAITLCLTATLIGNVAFATDYATLPIEINGRSMTLNSDYDASELPSGFHEAELEYQGTTFYGGVDDNTGKLELFHVTCESDDTLSGWYFRASDDSLSKYDGLDIASKHLMVLTPGSDVTVPEGYAETEIPVNNTIVKAWAPSEDASAALIGTYLLYGSFDGANIGWYVYDQREETVQRYIQTTDSQVIVQQDDKITKLQEQLTELNDKYNKDVSKSKNMFLIAMLAAVLFFFLMINAILKRRHIRLDLEDRIEDLKRHGGVETRQFSKMEARYNARRDAKAAKRAIKYEDSVGADVFDYDPTQSDGSGLQDLADVRARSHKGSDEGYNYDAVDTKKSRKQEQAERKAAKKAEKAQRKRGKKNDIEAEIAAAEAAVASGSLNGLYTVDEQQDEFAQPAPRKMRRAAKPVAEENGEPESPRRARRPCPDSSQAEMDMNGREQGDRPRRMDRNAERAQAERAVASKPAKQSRKSRQIAANGTTVLDEDGKQIQVKNRPVKRAKISRDTLADTEKALSGDSFDYEELERNLAGLTEEVMNQPERKPKATLSSSANMEEVSDRNHSFDVDFVEL